jgi:prefoldin subunit 5
MQEGGRVMSIRRLIPIAVVALVLALFVSCDSSTPYDGYSAEIRSLSSRIDELASQLSNLESQLEQIGSQLDNIETSIDEINSSVSDIETSIDLIRIRLSLSNYR